MAFFKDPKEDLTQNTNQPGYLTDTTSGAASETPSAPGNGQAPVSGWTNLNNYVDQNKGSGGAMAQGILTPGQKSMADLGKAGETYTADTSTESAAGTKKDTAGYEKKFKSGDLSSTQFDTDAYKELSAQPDYTGPTSAATSKAAGAYNGQAGKTENEVDRARTMEGQYGLAKENLGKGNDNYNSGMSMLDTVLAHQAGGAGAINAFTDSSSKLALKGKDEGVKNIAQSNIDANKQAGMNATRGAAAAAQKRYDAISRNATKDNGLGGISVADSANNADLQALKNLQSYGVDTRGNVLERSKPIVLDKPTEAELVAAPERTQEREPLAEPAMSTNPDDFKPIDEPMEETGLSKGLSRLGRDMKRRWSGEKNAFST